ncbi:hypothetical protein SH2C18_15100 [Clostridium sediminicola]|uniref:hypothetical protein n=1 Tax=Clostridium sediminicola TaxID=3114879 RepID=UPI0031F238FE
MKELRIFDKVDNNKYILELGYLVKIVNSIDGVVLKGEWEIVRGAYGYGEAICQIEDKLNNGERCFVSDNEIFPLLLEDEQYFYHVTMMKVGSDISIGVFDSTFLFIKSDDERLICEIMNHFKNIQLLNL